MSIETSPATTRVHFRPEAWVNDYATEVDPEGPQTWDVTPATAAQINTSTSDLDFVKDDPNAPQWVRAWPGPFTITVLTPGSDEGSPAPSPAWRTLADVMDPAPATSADGTPVCPLCGGALLLRRVSTVETDFRVTSIEAAEYADGVATLAVADEPAGQDTLSVESDVLRCERTTLGACSYRVSELAFSIEW